MTNCKCCGHSISEHAQSCPHCGEPSPAPPPPPPPLGLAGVLRSAGLDRRTVLAGIAVFCGVGLATVAYQAMSDHLAVRNGTQRAAEEKARRDEELVRRLLAERRSPGNG